LFLFAFSSFSFASSAAELKEIQEGYNCCYQRQLASTRLSGCYRKLQGLEIDLAKRLAQDLVGNSAAVRLQSVAIVIASVVLEGKVDLTIARVTATASRAPG